ncbi:hypothetical protein DB30_02091 [Enhygromyxa salina]|uniref:Uncharacterized protein n=1 Tax=Enhygromyxa salina TaxID=215803 RepID=A0A0C2CLB6_9BACT|nr:hypothetical protein [Enhygromyxa salina]KIG12036.1 hypothetical protein DB30_02091 [Enhygromyxa salina]
MLMIRERVPGFLPAKFWQESPARDQWQAMTDKYTALAAAAKLAAAERGPAFRKLLVELSSRWPGALRESELVGPERVLVRHAAAAAGLALPNQARAPEWANGEPHQATPTLAVLCWAELHELIRDQLEFRAALGRGTTLTTTTFAAWIRDHDDDRAQRWPQADRLPGLVGPKLRVRGAYLWLAARAGLDLPSLNALLFARAGHWDRRPDDPAWATGAVE